MSLRTSSRRCHALLNAASSTTKHTSTTPTTQTRTLRVPALGRYDTHFASEGIKNVFTPAAFKIAWTDYQTHMVDRLNRILAGDRRESWDAKTLLLSTARDPATASTFNYASMAHNNHFFFESLSPNTTSMPDGLSKALASSFSSVATARSTLLATAAGMFGPGFVWLVQDTSSSAMQRLSPGSSSSSAASGANATPQFKILTTYLAGTPYPGAHHRQQSRDLSTQNLASAEDHRRQTSIQNSVGAFGSSSASSGMESLDGPSSTGSNDVRRFGGADIVPVLCVNTWEHAWLHDFGVAGKRKYLEAWWEKVDWEAVWARCIKPGEGGVAGGSGNVRGGGGSGGAMRGLYR